MEEGEDKGELLIQNIWTQGMDIIQNMLVVNNDAVSYQSKAPDKFIENSEREKKKN